MSEDIEADENRRQQIRELLLEPRLRVERILLANLRQHATKLGELLTSVNDRWGYEDGFYRFYYGSFKVYHMQSMTTDIVAALAALAPEGRTFCEEFQHIVRAGTGRAFTLEVNNRWMEETAPILQSFVHARYFLEMATKYATLEEPPQPMPSGYAALLCLFGMR